MKKYIITILLILIALPSFSLAKTYINIAPRSIDAGLINYWTFDGKDMINGVARDSIGTSNGSLTNIASSTFYSSGKIGQGLTFDGVDDQIVLSPTVTTGTTFTLCTWIKPDAQVEDYGTVFTFNTGGGFWYRGSGGASNGKITFYYNGADNLNNTALTNGVWNYYCASVSGGNSTFYLNGVADGTATGAVSFDANNIGDDGGSETYKGSLDDMRFYNRALSASEIKLLYVSGVSTVNISNPLITNGLALWYTFDGKSMVNGRTENQWGGTNLGRLVNISTSTFYQFGKTGQAFSFDGTNDTLQSATAPVQMSQTAPWTMAIWVFKRTSIANRHFIFQGNKGTTNAPIASIGTSNDTNGHIIAFFCKENVACFQTPSIAAVIIPNNTWNHLAAVYDGTVMTLYINGASTTSALNNQTGITTGTANGAYVGSQANGSNTFVNAKIDDVRFYDRALQASEVMDIYRNGKVVIKSSI